MLRLSFEVLPLRSFVVEICLTNFVRFFPLLLQVICGLPLLEVRVCSGVVSVVALVVRALHHSDLAEQSFQVCEVFCCSDLQWVLLLL